MRRKRRIRLPISAQCKGIRHQSIAKRISQFHLFSEFRRDTEQFQHRRIHCDFFSLLRHRSGSRKRPAEFRIIILGITHFRRDFKKCILLRHGKQIGRPAFPDQRIIPQIVHLFLGQPFEAAVRISSHLTHHLLFGRMIQRNRDRKQCRKHHRRQCDRKDRHQISCTVCAKDPKRKPADRLLIFHFHAITSSPCDFTLQFSPAIFPSSIRMISSAICAISSLCVIMTIVCSN